MVEMVRDWSPFCIEIQKCTGSMDSKSRAELFGVHVAREKPCLNGKLKGNLDFIKQIYSEYEVQASRSRHVTANSYWKHGLQIRCMVGVHVATDNFCGEQSPWQPGLQPAQI